MVAVSSITLHGDFAFHSIFLEPEISLQLSILASHSMFSSASSRLCGNNKCGEKVNRIDGEAQSFPLRLRASAVTTNVGKK